MGPNNQCPRTNKDKCIFYHALNLNHKIRTDQTGKFNVRSIGGCNYTMVTYCYDANAILNRTLFSTKGSELLEAIKGMHQYLELRGCKQNNQTLDNESSVELRDYLNKYGM